MTPETITSRDNSLLRQARAVRDGKTNEQIFVEGLRLCEEALRSGLAIDAVIVSEELAEKDKWAETVARLSAVSQRFALVSEKLLESVSYTKTPQGIVLLAPSERVCRNVCPRPKLIPLDQAHDLLRRVGTGLHERTHLAEPNKFIRLGW